MSKCSGLKKMTESKGFEFLSFEEKSCKCSVVLYTLLFQARIPCSILETTCMTLCTAFVTMTDIVCFLL